MSNTTEKKGICLNIGNCAKANSKEEVTIHIGEEFVCPDCGGDLVEVKKSEPPKGLIVAGIVIALAVAGASVYYFTRQEEPPKTAKTTDLVAGDAVVVEEILAGEEGEETSIAWSEPTEGQSQTVSASQAKQPQQSNGIVTKDLGYAVWTGQMKNGKPHDVQGIMKFKSSHIIEARDEKGRVAGPGDKVIGTYEDGHLTSGKWYKMDGNVESVVVGGV